MIINTWDTKIRKGPFLFDRSENEATNEYESFTNKGIPQPHKAYNFFFILKRQT